MEQISDPQPISVMKIEKQKVLWEEFRNSRDMALKIMQWGVTVLVTLQTAIAFFRKDLFERMFASGELLKGQYIPWNRYLLGTIFLFIVASIFTYILFMVGNRYKKTRAQLIKNNIYDIEFGEVGRSARYVILLLFYIFPIVDLLLRLYVKIEFEFK